MSTHENNLERNRHHMVQSQIIGRGVTDKTVIKAMLTVPRELFVPPEMVGHAYADCALPIGEGQTISQPYIVALMIEALQLGRCDKVLEIGAGSGYAAAILAEISKSVFAIERVAALAEKAKSNLRDAGYGSVQVRNADGTKGWPTEAPFDAILVSAGGPDVPQSLKNQLAINGRLVIPVGPLERVQELVRITRKDEDHFDREFLGDVRFVPLIGEEGWTE